MRLKLLKVGALVRINVRRITIAIASACRWQHKFALHMRVLRLIRLHGLIHGVFADIVSILVFCQEERPLLDWTCLSKRQVSACWTRRGLWLRG